MTHLPSQSPYPDGDDPAAIGHIIIAAHSMSPHDSLSLLANALIVLARMAEVSDADVLSKVSQACADRRRGMN